MSKTKALERKRIKLTVTPEIISSVLEEVCKKKVINNKRIEINGFKDLNKEVPKILVFKRYEEEIIQLSTDRILITEYIKTPKGFSNRKYRKRRTDRKSWRKL